jgi:hypothetical protein
MAPRAGGIAAPSGPSARRGTCVAVEEGQEEHMNMTRRFALPAAAALALCAGLAGAQTPAPDDAARTGIVISGTVVSAANGTLVLRTDDHRHSMKFDLGSAAGSAALRRGERVAVRYHPTGATGQAVDEVTPLGRGQAAVNQASFRPVQGGDTDIRRAASMDDAVDARGEGVRSGQSASPDRPDTAAGADARARAAEQGTATSARDADTATADRTAGDRTDLPATASALPATAAGGLLLLAGGLALGLGRRSA